MKNLLKLICALALAPLAFGQATTGIAKLNLTQILTATGDLTPTQITSNQNDYAPTNFATAFTLRLSTDASRNLTGLAGGAAGRVIFLNNVGSNPLVLVNQSASSSAANRFALSANVTLPGGSGCILIYDTTASRWAAPSIGAAPSNFTNPIITTGILDSNSNNLFTLTATGTAINYLNYANAAAGGNPAWTSAGGDTNIGQNFVTKGTGNFSFTNAVSGGEYRINNTTGSVNISLQLAAVTDAILGVAGSASALINGTATGDLVIRSNATNIDFSTDSGTSISAKLTSTTGALLLLKPTAGLGYGTGAGGAITQGTSRTTGVTLNTVTGDITLFSAAGSATPASFTVTDSAIGAKDGVVINELSGTDLYEIFVTNIAAGSFKVTFFTTGGTTTEQPVFHFTIIKGANS